MASEIFQKRLQDLLGDLKGIIIVADDIVIHASTQAEHDEYLRALLQRCQEIGIKLNPAKFETSLSCLTFLGHRITRDGLQADPEKVQAISNMKAPSDRTELRRFLGMVTYLAKFIPLGFRHTPSTAKPNEEGGSLSVVINAAGRLQQDKGVPLKRHGISILRPNQGSHAAK